MDDQLTFNDYVASASQLCCFALFNTKKIRLFLSQHVPQLLVQAMMFPCIDYSNVCVCVWGRWSDGPECSGVSGHPQTGASPHYW